MVACAPNFPVLDHRPRSGRSLILLEAGRLPDPDPPSPRYHAPFSIFNSHPPSVRPPIHSSSHCLAQINQGGPSAARTYLHVRTCMYVHVCTLCTPRGPLYF